MTKEQHDALMPSASDLEWHATPIAAHPASIPTSMKEQLAACGGLAVQCPKCDHAFMRQINKDDPLRYVCSCGVGVAIGFDS